MNGTQPLQHPGVMPMYFNVGMVVTCLGCMLDYDLNVIDNDNSLSLGRDISFIIN